MAPLGLEVVQHMFTSAGLCASVIEIVPLSGGTNSDVLEVKCSDVRSGFVLKRYAPTFAWKCAKEAFVYHLVEEKPSAPDAPCPHRRRHESSHPGHLLRHDEAPGTAGGPGAT
jgi:hypothetical protein